MNLFHIIGRIRSVHIPEKENPSALILVQYGPQRERQQNRAIEFINAVPIRIPAFRLEKCRAAVEEDAFVEISGRVQGVMKGIVSDGFVQTELVAERVNLVMDPDAQAESEGEA
ncbi:hypothetical protein [Thioalkalivibrio thiocyanodenitrificans]|uniref:hypothetical protein n=1 Tax=Thioalkalivibrio thiocyanodenitrificans TaxID=243063 RepID=UPI00037C6371|nr:hypothetical protein [Thioalkalivibrio thiocyanodenitrificans]